MTQLIEQPAKADRTFRTAKAFHGYLPQTYQIECSYQTVVPFFHRQGFTLKFPQPWTGRQDEKQRASFLEKLKQLSQPPDIDLWFADESGLNFYFRIYIFLK